MRTKNNVDSPVCQGYAVRMGRKKQWDERLNLTLPEGAKARIDEVLEEGEDRNAMVRSSIEAEIRKRHRRRDGVKSGSFTPARQEEERD